MNTYGICPNCDQVNRVPFDPPGGKAPVCGKCKTPLAIHDGVSEVSASAVRTLSEKSPLPVIADFWAPWCQPCVSFAPSFLRAARELSGRAVFVKVNTEVHPLAGDFYGIRGIPTLILLKNGVERARQSGAMPLPVFMDWVEALLQQA